MENKKSIALVDEQKKSNLGTFGTALSRNQMKQVKGGKCNQGDPLYPCSQLGSCGAPVGYGNLCCNAYC